MSRSCRRRSIGRRNGLLRGKLDRSRSIWNDDIEGASGGVIKTIDVRWNDKKHAFTTSQGNYQIRKIGKGWIGYWLSTDEPADETEPDVFAIEAKKKTIGFAKLTVKDNSVFIALAKSEKFAKGLLTDGKLQIDRLKEIEAAGEFKDYFDEDIELVRKIVPNRKSR